LLLAIGFDPSLTDAFNEFDTIEKKNMGLF